MSSYRLGLTTPIHHPLTTELPQPEELHAVAVSSLSEVAYDLPGCIP